MDYPDRKIFPSAIPGQEFKRSRAVVAALLALELEGTVTVDGKAVSPEHFLEVGEGGKMIFSSQPALKNFGAEVKRLFDQAARALAMKQDAQTPFNEIVAVLNPQKPTPQKKLTPRPWEVDINQVSVESLLPAIEYIVSDTANLLGLDESTFTKFDPKKGRVSLRPTIKNFGESTYREIIQQALRFTYDAGHHEPSGIVTAMVNDGVKL
ncbi:MAG: hypothetical protein UX85_C0001G0223 [Candidatus Beckwithbacteria bacterium GW2011_GWB1_47_15]|uniref:Uncharacterized protein n=1 Tax=Candidatus Beckwithbacteria bacterium GW2011_GWB1_47_15 TaxID=1618371 RepID=A0A0G1RXD4_9BACT|nr:MAG: hypothetical protein UY43_C0001G0902 [Candidatus Beckwithbacteria bacterium GW2011_GWC1_49_16]AQS30861.1 hypothetical protein [uncultured bacterium]KKU36045.1 MAG: hypothetical protein UX50_C0001G0222 [Candidatus Beckwithbacteria bacterium GW2011_GWA1_46_30]KKU62009.1 MAG: hypothetical protein UX85_C0001G0223 [Candidatus Beckwithbacteria bacterium GW2011_GWB1_47_15]KKU72437.1 MAG: hypothetical protein UX97_C0001G0307 [Candidatus Beckwithbacteria bacterium GW2011_GWA2_47_25]OGD49344.1 M